MNPRTLYATLHNKLHPQFNNDQMHALQFWIRPHLETIPEPQQEETLKRICQELLNNRPIQYILSLAFFGPLSIRVNEHTLIPRPETEEMCDLICKNSTQLNQSVERIIGLDIGTGSGCIPLYLLHHNSDWHFSAVDISAKALQVAQHNAIECGVQNRLTLQCTDFLSWDHISQDVNLLVSNPPYISEEEKLSMQAHVLQNEPHLALFVANNDPLLFYKHVAKLVQSRHINLSQPLHIWLEINQYHGRATLDLFSFCKQSILIQDISGNDRFIWAIA